MFRTHPVIVVRITAIALVLYYLLNLSSETIKVSKALEQSQYLLRDLVRYFLLLMASLGFWRLYRYSLGRIGVSVVVTAIFTAIFGIAAYVSLSLNLLLVPETSWQTPLLAFFEFLKSEFALQFQSFVGRQQSLAAWISNWAAQLSLQFIPSLSDFPTGRGWIKLYLLFKLLASILLKVVVVLGCGMFLFPRPLSQQNLLIACLIMLWLLSPMYGGAVSVLGSWILDVKPANGEALRNLAALIIVGLIAIRMWLDAAELKPIGVKRVKKKATKKPGAKKSVKKTTAKKTTAAKSKKTVSKKS